MTVRLIFIAEKYILSQTDTFFVDLELHFLEGQKCTF